jgi:hypothetical protein
VLDIRVGWTRESPGRANGRGENRSEGRQSRRKGDLSKAIRKNELIRYTEIDINLM